MVRTLNREKIMNSQETDLSQFANSYFWQQFHQGHYEKIDSISYFLSAAYSENPNHLETVNHLGWVHVWALSERQKLTSIPPNIIDHGTLSLKYFGESFQMNPHDPRVLAFLADLKMTVGSISDDDDLVREGYFNGKKSIRQWPEFNYFSIGYVFSARAYDSWQFKKGLAWQWKTLDECYCDKFDRENPDLSPYLVLEQSDENLKRKRACWNSWIAPHNVEGYYLNMGDMLVKSGDWKKGIQVYNLAKQVPQYDTWAFKDVLDVRISSAKENVMNFRKNIENGAKIELKNAMLVNTSISCMACHQMSQRDLDYYQDASFDWNKFKIEKNLYGIH